MTLQPIDKLSKGKEQDLISFAATSTPPGGARIRSLLGESGLLLGRHFGLIATASLCPGGGTGAPFLLGAVARFNHHSSSHTL